MPFTVTMPKLSPTMEEGTIVKWHAKEGDRIEAGQLLFEVATDKATVEYNALDEGFLRKILIAEGSEAIVNQPIAIFTEEKSTSIEGYQPEGEMPTVEEVSAPEVTEEKKAAAPPPKKAIAGEMAMPTFAPEPPLESYTFPYRLEAETERHFASPLAKKLAAEKSLDLSRVRGTGPRGRITSEDLEKAPKKGLVSFGERRSPEGVPGSYEEEKLTPIRKTVARRLQESKTFIPHFYVQQQIDAEPLIAMKDQLREGEVKVTLNDIIVRGCALALRQHPQINSGFNTANQTIVRFQTIDVAVAVSMPTGLITPILRHTDYKNIGQISAEIRALARRAKEGKLKEHEYKGGSFTVSNLGMYGITDFQAIINPPQAAILAVSGMIELPVIREKQVVPGKVMNLTISVDHRVIDGVAAAEFLRTLKRLLENPAILVL